MMVAQRIKRKLGALLYYAIAKRLPPSYSGLRLGQTGLRRFCGKLMLADCGKQVNIEKDAVFSAKVTLGIILGSASMQRFTELATLDAM